MAESPLETYRRLQGQARGMGGAYSAAADEQRGAFDTSMADLGGVYANRDRSGPLMMLAAGLLAPTRTGAFSESASSGLALMSRAQDRETDREIERAQKIATLRQARAKLSEDLLNNQRGVMGLESGLAGNVFTIGKDAREEARREEEIQRGRKLQEMILGGGGLPGGAGEDGLGGGIGDDQLEGGSAGDVLVGGSGTPQAAARKPMLDLTPAERLLLASTPPDKFGQVLAQIMQRKGSVELSPEGKRAKDLGFVPGTPEFADVVKKLLAGEYKPQGSSDTSEQRGRLAESMGLPAMPIEPTAGLTPANSERLRLQLAKDAEKAASEADAAATQARTEMNDLDRFSRLNKDNSRTGKLWGLLPSLSDTATEMDSISANLARQQRQPGEGAVSDFDARMFQRMVPSTSLSYEANQELIAARRAAGQAAIEKAEYLRAYQTAYGHLHGAENAWKTYSNENPIFDKSGNGRLNQNRVGWREFFGAQRRGAQQPPPPGGNATPQPGSGRSRIISVEQ